MDDLDEFMKHWNNYEMRRFGGDVLPFSRKAEKSWLERATKWTPWEDGMLDLVIEDKDTRQFLGTVTLWNISKQNRRAGFAIAIHNPENYDKGYGSDATRVMLWVGFHVLGLNSIWLQMLDFNERALHVYGKIGFQRTGFHRQAVFLEGQFHDLIIMDILRDEFMKNFPSGTKIGG